MDHKRALADILALSRGAASWNGIIDVPLLRAARHHDVAPLVYQSLRLTGSWDRQSVSIRDAFAQITARAALVEEVRRLHLCRVIDALHSAGLTPVIFKGTALAYRHYAHPWLRPRIDTDLFIRADQLPGVVSIFDRMDLKRGLRPTGHHVTHQQTYQTTSHGVLQQYDVHWKISDPQVFADLLSYDELCREAVPAPQLAPGAQVAGDVHALLIACVHRVAHHFDSDSLLWMYDIDLIGRALDERAWNRVLELASEKRIQQVCARGLAGAIRLFQTPVPPRVLDALTACGDFEPTAVYLRDGLRRVDILRSDLKALSWSARARLLREHLLPEPSFILQSYHQTQPLLLPVLYLHRIVRGAFDWFKPLRG